MRQARVCRRHLSNKASHRVSNQEEGRRATGLGIPLLQSKHAAYHERHLPEKQATCGEQPSLPPEGAAKSSPHRPGRRAPPESQMCTSPARVCGSRQRRCAALLPLRQATAPAPACQSGIARGNAQRILTCLWLPPLPGTKSTGMPENCGSLRTPAKVTACSAPASSRSGGVSRACAERFVVRIQRVRGHVPAAV